VIPIKSLVAAATLSCVTTLAQAQVLGVATNPQGSLYYSVGAAVAQVMQQKAELTTRVQPMSGSSVYTPLLDRGQVEFGLLNALDVVNAFNGVDNFKDRKHGNLRLVGVMFALPIGMAVPNDSPVKAIKDLKGLRVPSQFTAQSTIRSVQDACLATGGLSTAELQQFPVPDYVKGMLALGDGKVDAALFGLGTSAAQEVNVALASHGGLRFVPLPDTPEAMTAMRKVFSSSYSKVFDPSPGNVGIVVPTRIMVYSAFLVTSSNISDDVVYKTVKALYTNKDVLAAASASLKSFDPKAMAEMSEVPFHPGAEKFYKEVGEWPPKRR
jgi:TRAP transporter TAXI family solute receptor